MNHFSSCGFRRTLSVILRRNPQIVCKCSILCFIRALYAFILLLSASRLQALVVSFYFPKHICMPFTMMNPD